MQLQPFGLRGVRQRQRIATAPNGSRPARSKGAAMTTNSGASVLLPKTRAMVCVWERDSRAAERREGIHASIPFGPSSVWKSYSSLPSE